MLVVPLVLVVVVVANVHRRRHQQLFTRKRRELLKRVKCEGKRARESEQPAVCSTAQCMMRSQRITAVSFPFFESTTVIDDSQAVTRRGVFFTLSRRCTKSVVKICRALMYSEKSTCFYLFP